VTDAAWSTRMADTAIERWPMGDVSGKGAPHWQYEEGTLLQGVTNVWYATANPKYYNYVKDSVDALVAKDGSIATYNASGNALAAGSFAPSASQSLLATETYDLPLNNAPTMVFPSTVRGAVLPVSSCNGSICPGAAAYLAKLTIPASATTATAALALSVDDSPNLTLRNLGSAQAAGMQIAVSGGFTQANNCGATLAAGGECSIALTGNGPGNITVSATNSIAQT